VPAARELLGPWREPATAPAGVHEPFRAALAGMLAATGAEPDAIAILADRGGAGASWELRWLGAFLGVPVLGLADVRARRGRVQTRSGGRPLQGLWQRTSEDRLRSGDGRRTALGELLEDALLAGGVQVVNRIGCGIADKRLMAYADGLIRGLLGEEPRLAAPETLDLTRPEARERALSAPEGWVFKPRAGAGGRGVALGAVPRAARRDPGGWVAQRRLRLSVHPTVAGDGLDPRPVDLRAFAFRRPGGGFVVPPGGVSRYAPWAGGGIVNTSSGGGVKDVWVV
jgi:carboxylate-amine ligase